MASDTDEKRLPLPPFKNGGDFKKDVSDPIVDELKGIGASLKETSANLLKGTFTSAILVPLRQELGELGFLIEQTFTSVGGIIMKLLKLGLFGIWGLLSFRKKTPLNEIAKQAKTTNEQLDMIYIVLDSIRTAILYSIEELENIFVRSSNKRYKEDLEKLKVPEKEDKKKDKSGAGFGMLGVLLSGILSVLTGLLGIFATPLTVALAGLVGAGAGVIVGLFDALFPKSFRDSLLKKWKSIDVEKKWLDLANKFKTKWDELSEKLGIDDFILKIKTSFQTFKDKLIKKFSFLDDLGGGKVMEGIDKIKSVFKTIFDVIKSKVGSILNGIKSVGSKVGGFFTKIFKPVISLMSGLKTYLTNSIFVKVFTTAFKIMKPLFKAIAWPLTLILTVWDAVNGWMQASDIFGPNANFVQKIESALASLASSLTFGIFDTKSIAQWLDKGRQWLMALPETIMNFIQNFPTFIKDSFNSIAEKIKKEGILSVISDIVLWFPSKIVELFKWIIESIYTKIKTIDWNPLNWFDSKQNTIEAVEPYTASSPLIGPTKPETTTLDEVDGTSVTRTEVSNNDDVLTNKTFTDTMKQFMDVMLKANSNNTAIMTNTKNSNTNISTPSNAPKGAVMPRGAN